MHRLALDSNNHYIIIFLLVCLFVIYVPSTARSFINEQSNEGSFHMKSPNLKKSSRLTIVDFPKNLLVC